MSRALGYELWSRLFDVALDMKIHEIKFTYLYDIKTISLYGFVTFFYKMGDAAFAKTIKFSLFGNFLTRLSTSLSGISLTLRRVLNSSTAWVYRKK